jgi:hypothetical protein
MLLPLFQVDLAKDAGHSQFTPIHLAVVLFEDQNGKQQSRAAQSHTCHSLFIQNRKMQGEMGSGEAVSHDTPLHGHVCHAATQHHCIHVVPNISDSTA